MTSRPSSNRRAFTLVEMLVVLGIIGVLVALLLPAINAAVNNARRAQILFEIKQLDVAFETYKQQKGEYPPSLGERNTSNALIYNITTTGVPNRYNSIVERHLQTAYPKFRDNTSVTNDPKDNFYNQMLVNSVNEIDQAEALVLWLAGTSTAPANPFEGFTATPPFNFTVSRNAFFEFDMRRIVDLDNDGFPTYQPKHCRETDYVYMENRSYTNYTRQGNYARVIRTNPPITYEILPYAANATSGVNPTKFQIVCAGLDGDFGTPLPAVTAGAYNPKIFPVGTNYTPGDKDNLTNFSGGTLGDARPQ